MIERIANLKPWQIVAAGGASCLAGLVAIAFLSHLGYALFPEAWAWVAVFHFVGSGAAVILIARPFIEAYIFRGFLDTWQSINLRSFDEDEQ